MESDLGNIFLSSGLTAGGIGSIIWYFIKRLIGRIDKLEAAITGKDGLETQLALNITKDEAFVQRFEDHLETHTGIRDEVRKMLDEFKIEMDRRYKQK